MKHVYKVLYFQDQCILQRMERLSLISAQWFLIQEVLKNGSFLVEQLRIVIPTFQYNYQEKGDYRSSSFRIRQAFSSTKNKQPILIIT